MSNKIRLSAYKTTYMLLYIAVQVVILVSFVGCGTPIYTTKDLAPLPCEPASFYFQPIEFDDSGEVVYADQIAGLKQRLIEGQVQDLYVFIHGWDKPPVVAERDYQDFICRIYNKGYPDAKVSDAPPFMPQFRKSVILGVFWRSSVFPNSSDPDLIKFASYFPIRNRADRLAQSGFQNLLIAIAESLTSNNAPQTIRLHLIGHSFGARIIVKGVPWFLSTQLDKSISFFKKIELLNIILIDAAIPMEALIQPLKEVVGRQEHFIQAMSDAESKHKTNRLNEIDLPRFTNDIRQFAAYLNAFFRWSGFSPESERIVQQLRIFNIYSENDWANRLLFPLASIFTIDDSVGCALGGCGAPGHPTITTDDAGQLKWNDETGKNIFINNVLNIDASNIISSHTDIYKGRVADMIWQLLRRQPTRLHISN